jgi:3'-phosphoadenosine 5'-phosphosulfate sulfotransferase (PAPS reductase)/FAD synthetase
MAAWHSFPSHMNPQLADYDYVVVNTSSGKDSQTSLRFIMNLAEQEGYPKKQIVCAHADLGAMEWPGTVELAQKQAELYGVRFWKIARPQGDLLSHILKRGKWPDSKNKYCTSDMKRDQIGKLFTEIVARLDGSHRKRILNVMGMRAQESPARSKLKPFSPNIRFTNGKRQIDNWLPIHSLTLGDVWQDIKASSVPYHKAYDLGMPRLSCVFCIFSPPPALMIAGRNNPELLASYVEAEKKMGHTFRKDFPIEKVQQAIAAGEDWGSATDWVM